MRTIHIMVIKIISPQNWSLPSFFGRIKQLCQQVELNTESEFQVVTRTSYRTKWYRRNSLVTIFVTNQLALN